MDNKNRLLATGAFGLEFAPADAKTAFDAALGGGAQGFGPAQGGSDAACVIGQAGGWRDQDAASYVGATRLEENAHHLTDVFAGAAIGYIVGRTVTRSHHKGPERITWTITPVHGGAVGGLAIQLGALR